MNANATRRPAAAASRTASGGASPPPRTRSRARGTRTGRASRSGTRSPTRRGTSRTATPATSPTTTTTGTRRRRADAVDRRHRLPVLDLLAADLPRRHRPAEREGPRLLQPPRRRVARRGDRAVRHAVPLGPAAGAPGPVRRLAVDGDGQRLRRVRRPRGRAPQRPREALLHDQRVPLVRGHGPPGGRRRRRRREEGAHRPCPGAPALGRRAEPGSASRRPRSRARGQGDPRPRPGGHEGGARRQHHGRRTGHRRPGVRRRRPRSPPAS